ncbi:MAG TPA: NAD-dependent epimerase/dehydratase family protein, partial [Cytophagaceae bacterium]|nr:NAD-dependent epimerase/dehydratase family protein [Cytophagaceae bacterium]
MSVLVTGANGFLATNIIVELVRRKYIVHGLLRHKNKFQLKDSSVTLYTGNLFNEEDIRKAAYKCDTIIHVAANTSQYLNDYN